MVSLTRPEITLASGRDRLAEVYERLALTSGLLEEIGGGKPAAGLAEHDDRRATEHEVALLVGRLKRGPHGSAKN